MQLKVASMARDSLKNRSISKAILFSHILPLSTTKIIGWSVVQAGIYAANYGDVLFDGRQEHKGSPKQPLGNLKKWVAAYLSSEMQGIRAYPAGS